MYVQIEAILCRLAGFYLHEVHRYVKSVRGSIKLVFIHILTSFSIKWM